MSRAGEFHRGKRRWWPVWMAYFGLLAIGVPWYWPAGFMRLWFGMPAWVLTSLAASVGVSVLTALVLSRPWPGEREAGDEEPTP